MVPQKMKKQKAFTLVELIIVITILAILASIAFVSFSSYTKTARDANRLSTLSNIEKGLQAFQITTGKYPLPDEKIEITSSGVLVGYQGNVGTNVSQLIKMNNVPQDPVDGGKYVYQVNGNQKSLQLMTFLEQSEGTPIAQLIKHEVYADNSLRYPKVSGDKLGILLDTSNNPVVTNIDLSTYSGSNLKMYVDNGEILTGTGGELLKFTSNANCKRILESGQSRGDGVYKINPAGDEFEVYCDMTTDGGGWTLVVKRKHSTNNIEECGTNLNSFLHGFCNKNSFSQRNLLDNFSYSLGNLIQTIHTSEYMFLQYNKDGLLDADDAYIIQSESNLFPNSTDLHHIPVKSVCSLDKNICDATDVIWKYVGNYHFNNGACNGTVGISYAGAYGYCHNGADENRTENYFYNANSLFGNRASYYDLKLWGYPVAETNAKDYLEHILVR